jgi:L-rhamnose mutarotase
MLVLKKKMMFAAVALTAAALILGSCHRKDETPPAGTVTKRVGMVIELNPERMKEYLALHANSNPGVRDLPNKYHVHNFSIWLQQIGERWYEFASYEYTGSDYEADMAALAAEPRNLEWLKVCDPTQIPLPGSDGWTEMKQIYYNR